MGYIHGSGRWNSRHFLCVMVVLALCAGYAHFIINNPHAFCRSVERCFDQHPLMQSMDSHRSCWLDEEDLDVERRGEHWRYEFLGSETSLLVVSVVVVVVIAPAIAMW